jgi:hypothetical protein
MTFQPRPPTAADWARFRGVPVKVPAPFDLRTRTLDSALVLFALRAALVRAKPAALSRR